MLEKTLLHNDHIEEMDFDLGQPKSLKVAKIAAVRNCMFGSIVHQLFPHKIGSVEHIQATRQLRESVVDYISGHFSSFEFVLKGRVYEDIKPELITDMDKECRIVLDYLSKECIYWGGAETLKAVQEMHQVNILTFEENGTFYFNEKFNATYSQTLIVASRLNNSKTAFNHYDSVCDISSKDVLNLIGHLSSIFQNSNSVFNETL